MAKADEVKFSAGWQAAVNETLAEKMEGKLLAVVAGETIQKEGEDGATREVTLCLVFDITNEPDLMDTAAPFGWQVVREQLRRTTPENPWLVGRLVKKGRAYILESPKVNEVKDIGPKIEACANLASLLDSWGAEVVQEDAF